jgi:hypothetical protein
VNTGTKVALIDCGGVAIDRGSFRARLEPVEVNFYTEIYGEIIWNSSQKLDQKAGLPLSLEAHYET